MLPPRTLQAKNYIYIQDLSIDSTWWSTSHLIDSPTHHTHHPYIPKMPPGITQRGHLSSSSHLPAPPPAVPSRSFPTNATRTNKQTTQTASRPAPARARKPNPPQHNTNTRLAAPPQHTNTTHPAPARSQTNPPPPPHPNQPANNAHTSKPRSIPLLAENHTFNLPTDPLERYHWVREQTIACYRAVTTGTASAQEIAFILGVPSLPLPAAGLGGVSGVEVRGERKAAEEPM